MNRRALWIGLGIFTLLAAACTSSSDDALPSETVPVVSSSSTTPSTTTTAPSTTLAPTTTTTTTTTIPIEDLVLATEVVGSGFDHPVLLVADPAGTGDLVVEQPGRIVRFEDGVKQTVLDINEDVLFQGEQGLLGLAFHPDFATNRLAYLSYIGSGPRTVIEQIEVVDGLFDVSTRLEVLSFSQPASNHNGGMIAFGPDEYLWIGLGDGGRSNDSLGHAQRTATLHGSMLRIAVGDPSTVPYAIPDDNPYADGADGRQEIWAIGLRNPWRFAFDGNDLWIADVGQGRVEEINLTNASDSGLNYGWSIMEGSECFKQSACTTDGLVMPITEYSHGEGCSVTGGVVYRGDQIPSLRGQFFYADFCSGLLRSIDADGREFDWTEMVGPVDRPTGFGVGSDGEVYVTSQGGDLIKIIQEGS